MTPVIVKVALMDCGHKVVVLLPSKRVITFRNPFRKTLTDEQWLRGDNKWHWPVSLFAH